MRRQPRRLRLRRKQRPPIIRRVPHIPHRPVRPRRIMVHRALLRPNEALVLRPPIGRVVDVELQVLHPEALEHRLVVVAARRRVCVVARLFEDAVHGEERDGRVERDFGLREEGGVARCFVERPEAGGDDALVVCPGRLAVVRAGAREAGG